MTIEARPSKVVSHNLRSRFTRMATLSFLRRSLPARLTAAFLALSLTTVLVVTFVSYRSASSALRQRLVEHLDALAEADAADLREWVKRQRATLEYQARLPTTVEAARRGARDPQGLRRDTSFARVLDGARAGVIAATEQRLLSVPGGMVLASSDTTLVGSYAVDQLYYQQGRDSTFTQNIYPSGITGRPTLTIATPVRVAGRSAPAAVLAAHLDLQELERVLINRQGDVPIDAYLVNRFSEFVSAERFGRAEFRRGIQSAGISRALAGESGSSLYRDYDGVPVIGIWRWLPEFELALLIEAPQAAAFAPARRLLAGALIVGVLAAGLLTFGVVAITRRATQPVLAIAAAADRVARGDFGGSAAVESEDEVGQLARTFNGMTTELRSLYGELNEQVSTTRSALHEAQASRALLQDVVDHTTAIVCVVGLDDRVRLANSRFEAVATLDRGRSAGRELVEVLSPGAAPALREALDDTRRLDMVVEREIDLATGAESHTWNAVCFPLRDAQGNTYAFGVIATDLTERARAEEERRHRDATVQQAQKLESLGIMAGGIAHDFNNILGAVMGNAELAMSAAGDPIELRESLEQITGAARRASDLTRQMLAYAGKATFRREIVDVRRVLTEMLALVRAAQPKLVEFIVIPMPTPLWVEVDPAQLAQVALNLLTNAAEAIGGVPGSVTLTAGVSAAPPGAIDTTSVSWIRFSVADTGTGMSEEVRARIFEPFFSTKQSGRGLGLSAVTGIIKSSGGVLLLESQLHVGTRFDVYLPAAPSPPFSPRAVDSVDPSNCRGEVLVIDDEAPLRRVCRRALETMGLTVIEAVDGLDGVARYRERREFVSAVVLDLTMPGMGGAEVLEIIRADRPTLPVIVASGYGDAARSGNFRADPHTRFLQKPFGVGVFTRMIGELLD